MTGIEDRIAAVIAEHHTVYHGSAACRCGKFPAGSVDFDGHDAHVAAAVVAELGLALSLGGQYVAYGVTLTDEERDRAGFTYHREERR